MTRRSRPRVGFDARALRFPAGGVRRYASELLRHLPAAAPDLEIVAIDAPPDEALPAGVVRGPAAMRLPGWVPGNLVRAAWALPFAVRAADVDVFHAPAYTAPFLAATPVVLSVHDVSYVRRPEYYAHSAGPLRQWFYRRSAIRAARIVTGSTFSRDEIVAAYGIDPGRITIAPDGVSAQFRPMDPSVPVPMLPRGVREPFVLHVGELHRRRDLTTALAAVVRVRREGHASAPPLQLVCAGVDRGVGGDLLAAARATGESDRLVLTGSVSEVALLGLYGRASALVYPSRYEGFGLPVLEAMASGLPVIAARAASLPEVVGDAGLLVPPGDVDALSDAIARVVFDEGLRARLGSLGRERAAAFTWNRTASITAGVYRQVCSA